MGRVSVTRRASEQQGTHPARWPTSSLRIYTTRTSKDHTVVKSSRAMTGTSTAHTVTTTRTAPPTY